MGGGDGPDRPGQLTAGGGTLYVRASSEEILASMLAADKVL